MSNNLNFLISLVLTVVIPLGLILGTYFNILPSSVPVVVGTLGVIAAILYIVGGNLTMMYQDIKTKRYSK
jgi:hypothetical protein